MSPARTRRRPRTRLLLAGVGGQGVLGAARILGEAAVRAGEPVSIAQLHGMSQRGGSVEASVVLGNGQGHHIGPLEADALLAFEPFEAVRALGRAGPAAVVVVMAPVIVPPVLAREGRTYPDVRALAEEMRGAVARVVLIDPAAAVEEAGDRRAIGPVALGALAGTGVLPFGEEALELAVVAAAPSGRGEAWRRAFAAGRALARGGAGAEAGAGAGAGAGAKARRAGGETGA